MNFKDYRKDPRSGAFIILQKSKNKHIVVVEGKDDVNFYQNKTAIWDDVEFISCQQISIATNNKSGVLRLKVLMDKFAPILHNKTIHYIVDRDFTADISKGNLLVTNVYCRENFTASSPSNNHYFSIANCKFSLQDLNKIHSGLKNAYPNSTDMKAAIARSTVATKDYIGFDDLMKEIPGKRLHSLFVENPKDVSHKIEYLDAKVKFNDINVLVELKSRLKY